MSRTKPVITCDACGKDITTTPYSSGYRVALRAEGKPHSGDYAYASRENAPIEDRDFCDLKCLKSDLVPNA